MEGKYVLITGASSGIGRAIAVQLSNEYRIILSGRNMERLQETKEMCHGEGHIIFVHDLAECKTIGDKLTAFLQEHQVSVFGFVHSAGISPIAPLRMTSLSQMFEIMNVNFFAAAIILKTLSNRKVNKKNLHNVVFVSSVAAIKGARGQAVYSASKGALNAFVKSMAIELAPNVRVNAVMPGGIRTAMTESLYDSMSALGKMDNNLLGPGSVEDIAEAVSFFMSDKSRWITGETLVVDGGSCVG